MYPPSLSEARFKKKTLSDKEFPHNKDLYIVKNITVSRNMIWLIFAPYTIQYI